MSQPSPSGKRVLTIDGGGIRGLGSLLVIEAITNAAHTLCREPGSSPLRPCEIFDVVCGAATGGLLAILIGRLGLDCATATKEYKTLVQKLCGNDRHAFMQILAKLSPTFDQKAHEEAYKSALMELISKHGLSATSRFYDPSKTRNTVVRYTDVPTVSWDSSKSLTVVDVARLTTPFVSPQAKESLGSDPPSSVISIGQGFTDNAVDMSGSRGQKAVDTFVALISPGYGDDKKWATIFVKKHLTQAEQTAKAHKVLSKNPGYHRIDPPLGVGKWELVDQFCPDLEANVKQWLTSLEGKSIIDVIAARLVVPLILKPSDSGDSVQSDKPVQPEIHVQPEHPVQSEDMIPQPPMGTIPPNLACKRPRPKEIDQYLKQYNTVFIIDDSTSMTYYGPRWEEARDALIPMADFALKYNTDSIDIVFLNSSKVHKAVKIRAPPSPVSAHHSTYLTMQDLLWNVKIQRTFTGACLEKVMDDVIGKLDAAVGDEAAYRAIRPFSVIVLTDGDADDNPKAVFEDAWAHLQAKKHHPNYVSVHIIQIGEDQTAATKLKRITSRNNGSIVDVLPYSGVLTPERLQGIILGAVQPNVRALFS